MKKKMFIAAALVGLLITSCSNDDSNRNQPTKNLQQEKFEEAKSLLAISAKEGSRVMYEPGKGVKFREQDSVYVKSALAIKLTKEDANVTLPLFRGLDPNGKSVYYIITEASTFEVANQMGINFSPKLQNAVGSQGVQKVTIVDGLMKFKGKVDFTPVHNVTGAAPDYFPPSSFTAGAVADAEWSSIVELPTGQVLNAQIVSNETGNHDRLVSIDKAKMSVTLSILDGFRDGKQYFFHLVTDASDELPAALEKGVKATRLALIPEFGKSTPSDKSAFLAFSPNANGITDISSGEGQGFAYSIRNGGVDPINVFPIAPMNMSNSKNNNYSPLWDAHVSKWTKKAFDEGKVKRIKSIKEQKELIAAGYLTSLQADETVPINDYVGLRPVKLLINCPVIAHPSSVNE